MGRFAIWFCLALTAGCLAPDSGTEQPGTTDVVREEVRQGKARGALTENAVEGYSEAPMLAARVLAGELPPVEQRLPERWRWMARFPRRVDFFVYDRRSDA